MDTALTVAAYAIGLLLTLVLASALTPAHWWRRPNARAATLLVAGTWGFGALLAGALQAANPQAVAAYEPPASQYQVFRALNLRDGTGTSAKRLAVVPAGAVVAATGMRDGDWWQVRVKVNGSQLTGWASSLWLRRADEGRR
ncbi:SH3 domain-containing protein [Massilia sp. GCM10020059]|uniref:SH3 domain-containing protein n=1 Tax=Massilia agrisoli TaxID=2892444 RepID=A0ABS8IWL1_9BURK|nr:SH3 domain-containing protein [Massilia agrisoli]MCC6072331.1 SH3 domain-containing protein [Massilia agrisoli]